MLLPSLSEASFRRGVFTQSAAWPEISSRKLSPQPFLKHKPLLLFLAGLTIYIVLQWRHGVISPEEKAAVAALPWQTDFQLAQMEAKETGKVLLLDFTGSDWCPPCKRLRKEVFAQPEFASYAREHLVLLEVDFPQYTPLAPEQRAKNEALARQFHVVAFPTVILLNPDGAILGQVAYAGGGANGFLAEIERLQATALPRS